MVRVERLGLDEFCSANSENHVDDADGSGKQRGDGDRDYDSNRSELFSFAAQDQDHGPAHRRDDYAVERDGGYRGRDIDGGAADRADVQADGGSLRSEFELYLYGN